MGGWITWLALTEIGQLHGIDINIVAQNKMAYIIVDDATLGSISSQSG